MSASLASVGRILLLMAGMGVLSTSAVADGIQPVTLKLREQESNRFLARWRVPTQLPASAIPSPVLPGSCRSVGERTFTQRPGAWFLQQVYLCPDGLAGQPLGIDYPFLNVTVSTLLRVELLSGDRYAHLLAPGEQSWRIPETDAGGARSSLRAAGQAVVEGLDHFAGNGAHAALAIVLVLLGGLSVSIRLVTAFGAGQLTAVAVFSVAGFHLGSPLAEVGVAAAVALLAREALRPLEQRRQLVALAAAAGLVHGLGLARLVQAPAVQNSSGFLHYSLVVLGMDAALLLAVLVGSGLRRIVPQRLSRRELLTSGVYGVGIAAIALVLVFPAADAMTQVGETRSGMQLPNLPIPEGAAATPGSKRVTAAFADAALQSFVAIAPFEVRHEVLVRLRDTAERVGLAPSGEVVIDIDAQDEVKQRIRDLVTSRTQTRIDGLLLEAADQRVEFLGLDARGALPRLAPIPESVESAWLGVTTVYVTESTPREVSLTWQGFDTEPTVPATVTDPETSRTVELNRRQPVLIWKNELAEDPTPTVAAISVEPPLLWIPPLSLPLLGFAIAFAVAAVQGRRRATSMALSRIGLACALLLAPVANIPLPLPGWAGSIPDQQATKQILSRVLPNIYRAFEFPTESAVYDRLASSVTGETLTDVYLEHRRAVRMEERGGAKARVEAVEVVDIHSVKPDGTGGFTAGTVWTVGGTVTHFGHRHFRQNRYDALVAVVPVDGYWKIRSIEVLDEKRLR